MFGTTFKVQSPMAMVASLLLEAPAVTLMVNPAMEEAMFSLHFMTAMAIRVGRDLLVHPLGTASAVHSPMAMVAFLLLDPPAVTLMVNPTMVKAMDLLLTMTALAIRVGPDLSVHPLGNTLKL
ncbi:MAG: hypothetical protein JW384_01376 [Nitrosomonadaceae bacterium]|nr:hypothetical protein [Nitrosomonadaceae bacterium]